MLSNITERVCSACSSRFSLSSPPSLPLLSSPLVSRSCFVSCAQRGAILTLRWCAQLRWCVHLGENVCGCSAAAYLCVLECVTGAGLLWALSPL